MTEGFIIALMLGGSFFIFLAGIGILRFSDPLNQAHPISKVVTLGLNLILLATICFFWNGLITLKLFLIILFHFVTIPVAGHIFARYAIQYEKSTCSKTRSIGK